MYDVDVCEKPNDNNVDLMSCREKAVNEIKMLMKEYVYASQHFMVDKKHGAALAAAQKAWEKQFSIDLNAGYLQFDPLGTLRISGGALLLLDLYRLRMETLIAMRG